MQSLELRWRSRDGLTLFARDYRPDADSTAGPPRAPVVCIPGLTRNSLDFGELGQWIAGSGRRVLAVDLRGRGESDRDPDPRRYQPPVYADDIAALLAAQSITRAIFIGTSLGGIVTLTLALRHPQCIAGAVLNDIGPEIDPSGAARIRGYVGKAPPIPDWEAAIAYVRQINGTALPGQTDADWEAMARRAFRTGADGKLELNYDPQVLRPTNALVERIAKWFAWRAFRKLAGRGPLLVLRGAHSDILGPATVTRMRRAAPAMAFAEIPSVGHAPTLSEPAARAALQTYLGSAP